MAYPSALDLELANEALSRLSERTISSFSENSPQARAVARIYPRTRDLMQTSGAWRFNNARAALGPAFTGVFPWAYEYLLPGGCLRPRLVLAGSAPAPGISLEPVPFEEGLSTASATVAAAITAQTTPVGDAIARVVWTDVSPATLVYNVQVLDPVMWDNGFLAAFTMQLASEICLPITGNGQLAQAMAAAAQRAIQLQMPPGQPQSVVQQQRGPSTTTAAR